MKLLVYGLMRSGTTLVCDLLTVPPRSLVFNEPMLQAPWRKRRAAEIHGTAKAFGLAVGDSPPTEEDFGSLAGYFSQVLEPQLRDLELWGFKETFFYRCAETLELHRPDRLILCVRDLQDITLSSLDLITGSKLVFTGTRLLRDEAWLLSRLTYDVRELLALRARPHLTLRYEELVGDGEALRRLARYVGLDRTGDGSLHRELTLRGTRARELEKHGAGLSRRAVARHRSERDPRALALARHVARALPLYAETFGYGGPTARRPGRESVTEPSAHELFQARLGVREVEDRSSAGPPGFDPAFALRRARRVVARNIRADTRVIELGCLLPVLKYLLPSGCSYLGLGTTARPADVEAADWATGRLPDAQRADLLAVVGALEFVADVRRFLAALAESRLEVLLTYHAREDTRSLDRESLGWRNDMSRGDLQAAVEALGFRVTALWAFDGYQSLLRLRP